MCICQTSVIICVCWKCITSWKCYTNYSSMYFVCLKICNLLLCLKICGFKWSPSFCQFERLALWFPTEWNTSEFSRWKLQLRSVIIKKKLVLGVHTEYPLADSFADPFCSKTSEWLHPKWHTFLYCKWNCDNNMGQKKFVRIHSTHKRWIYDG